MLCYVVLCCAVLCCAPLCWHECVLVAQPQPVGDSSATPLPPSLLPSLPRPRLVWLLDRSLFLVFSVHGCSPPSLPTQKISAPPSPGSLSPPDFPPSLPSAPLTLLHLLPSLLFPSSSIPLHHQLDSSANIPPFLARLIRPVQNFEKAIQSLRPHPSHTTQHFHDHRSIISNDHLHIQDHRFHPLNPTGARAQAKS